MSRHKREEDPQEPIEQAEQREETQEELADAVQGDIDALAAEIEKLTAERDEAKDQTLRTLADLQNFQRDFQNFRKRNQQEMALFRQIATEKFVTDLLPVLDNFERTIAHIEAGATVESLLGGIQAVERQLRSALESQNVKRIESLGQPFDPEIHEALGTEPTSEFPEDSVAIEIQPGYKMGDKVIRPARVKVAKPQ